MSIKESGLYKIIEEQSLLHFIGKLNLLDKKTKQLRGEIYFRDGELMGCRWGKLEGLRGLFAAFLERDSIIVVSEPEIIENEDYLGPFEQIGEIVDKKMQEINKNKHLRPDGSLKLRISPAFIYKGEEITHEEFVLLLTLTEHSVVKDVYKETPLLDYEVTDCLVSLRRKKALIVS